MKRCSRNCPRTPDLNLTCSALDSTTCSTEDTLLYRLAHKIDWGFFEKEFGPLYVEKVGRPGLPIRLLVGFHFLKHAFGESDESVVERFVENPYWHVRRIKIWHIRVPDFKVQVLGFGVGISWILTGSPGSAKVAV